MLCPSRQACQELLGEGGGCPGPGLALLLRGELEELPPPSCRLGIRAPAKLRPLVSAEGRRGLQCQVGLGRGRPPRPSVRWQV